MNEKYLQNEILLKIPGFTIAAKTWGNSSQPPLLALHGWLDNANSFNLLAPLLSEHFFVIAIDLPGHGLSSHLPEGCYYHFIDAVFILHQIIDALGYKQVHLLGHSMGACLASLAAGIFPEYCASMVLIDALGPLTHPPESFPAQMRAYLNRYQSGFLQTEKPYASIHIAAKARSQKGYISQQLAEILCERGMRQQGKGFYWRHDKRLLLPSPTRLTEDQVLACLQEIATPTLLIIADEGFSFDNKLFNARIKRVKSIEVNKLSGGHHVHMEEPDLVNQLLMKFFEA